MFYRPWKPENEGKAPDCVDFGNLSPEDQQFLPDLIGIGAETTGTTALHDYMNRHKRVIPVGERDFFSWENNYRQGARGLVSVFKRSFGNHERLALEAKAQEEEKKKVAQVEGQKDAGDDEEEEEEQAEPGVLRRGEGRGRDRGRRRGGHGRFEEEEGLDDETPAIKDLFGYDLTGHRMGRFG